MQQEVDKLTAEIYREKNSTTFNNIKLFEPQSNAPPDSGGGGSPAIGEPDAGIQTIDAGATEEVAATFAVRASEKPYDYQVEYISWPSNTSEKDYCIELGSFADYDAIDYTFTSTNTNTSDVLLGKNLSTAFIGYDSANKISMGYRANKDTGFTVSENITAAQKGDGTRKTLHFEYNLDGYTNSVMTIGGYNPSQYSQEKQIHQITCYKDGELVRDFIPVVDKNGEACMYDKVSGELFYNSGAKDFVTGVKIEEPEPPAPPPEEPKPKPTPPKPPTFRSGDVLLQIGANSGGFNQLGIDLTFDLDEFDSDVTTSPNASKTLEAMDKLKDLLVEKRSTVGAQRNRLESVINSNRLKNENLSSSYSTIMDTDFANETAKLTRQQILQQASASLLSQANTVPNIALMLLG